MSGFYGDTVIIERALASVSASTLAQVFVAPVDLEVVGLVAVLGTAAGGTSGNGVVLNVSNSPTSQNGVSAYNLWSAANAPSILNAATSNFTTSQSPTLVDNSGPYALNYPLPGPAGTAGYATAQSTTQTTETPVTTPPTIAYFHMSALVAPDNTYTNYNSKVSPASHVHAGDVLSFTVAAPAAKTVGSAANLALSLYCQKR